MDLLCGTKKSRVIFLVPSFTDISYLKFLLACCQKGMSCVCYEQETRSRVSPLHPFDMGDAMLSLVCHVSRRQVRREVGVHGGVRRLLGHDAAVARRRDARLRIPHRSARHCGFRLGQSLFLHVWLSLRVKGKNCVCSCSVLCRWNKISHMQTGKKLRNKAQTHLCTPACL